LVFLGAVGFLDDFIKLRRRKNEGLSARAKMFGQIAAGVGLGMYVYLAPVTPGATQLNTDDVTEWPQFVAQLTGAVDGESEAVADARERLRRRLMLLPAWPEMAPQPREPLSASDRVAVVENLNQLLSGGPFLSDELASAVKPSPEAMRLLEQGQANLSPRERYRLNRLLVEALFRETIAPSVANLHTHVEVPGFRFLLIPMGLLYILFVAVIIVGSSNAVNLTDGLDGLAIGASIMSLLAYTAIAYTVSRADWSRYLFLIYVPEASELTVFGAALLGTGLGFLWFNSHPAEVFMGDTGSLALGGVIGAMAVLTKQELLLPVVGGLFVLEAGSVLIQVASYKTRGKRVFRMAPLHHHFELKGWSESKVIVRFWILALLFALASLSALKLR
jgi:phospho-N-acetylmuramoyl-pentapeptide-transferase